MGTAAQLKVGEKTPVVLLPTSIACTRKYQRDPEIIARTARFKREYKNELKVQRMLHIKIVR